MATYPITYEVFALSRLEAIRVAVGMLRSGVTLKGEPEAIEDSHGRWLVRMWVSE